MNCLRLLSRTDTTCEIEVRPDAMDRYRRKLDRWIDRTVWVAGCRSWYKNAAGRVTNPWPASTMRYWRLTRQNPEKAFTTRPVLPGVDDRTGSGPRTPGESASSG
jgi:hypothetical protein